MATNNIKNNTIKQTTITAISLAEFRSWLAGVEAMAGKNWAPTKAQWKTIRKKIDSIKEQTLPVQNNQPQQFMPRTQVPQIPQQSSLLLDENIVANNDTAELVRKAKARMRTGGTGEEKAEPNIAGTINGPTQVSSFV